MEDFMDKSYINGGFSSTLDGTRGFVGELTSLLKKKPVTIPIRESEVYIRYLLIHG